MHTTVRATKPRRAETAPRRRFSVDVATSLSEARELAAEWYRLMDRAIDDEPFVTPAWLIPWWDAFGDGELRIVVVRDADRMVALLPLMIVREPVVGRERNVLRFCANPHTGRVCAVVDRTAGVNALRAALEWVMRGDGWEVARLGPMQDDAETTRLLRAELMRAGIDIGVRNQHASPYLPLEGSLDDILASLSGSFRQTLMRKVRKGGRVEGLRLVTDPTEANDGAGAFHVSTKTWQHENGTGISATAPIRKFYEGLADATRQRDELYVPLAVLDGEAVAYEYNLRYRGRVYNLKLGYDQDQGKWSPGMVLKHAVIEQAVADGMVEYDFLGAADPYKLHWTGRVRQLVEIRFVRRGVAARLEHWALFHLRPFLQRHVPWVLELKHRLERRRAATDAEE